MHPYKIHVFQSLTTVYRGKRTRFAGKFGDHMQQKPHTLEHIWFSDEAYTFTSRGTLTDKTCVSGALSIHIKFTNPLCMPRKSWCGVRFPRRAWLGLSRLSIMSLGRITPWCATPSSLNWDWDRRRSLHAQWFKQDGARPHTTPEVLEFLHSQVPASHYAWSSPTAIPVRILMATLQSRFKSVWLLHLGLSEG
jgi:hypothetical protein